LVSDGSNVRTKRGEVVRRNRRVLDRWSVRGVIFDLDGTLADTIPVCLAAFRSAFERYLGRRWDEEEIKALSGPTAQIQSRAR
jgi:hypothetical protein